MERNYIMQHQLRPVNIQNPLDSKIFNFQRSTDSFWIELFKWTNLVFAGIEVSVGLTYIFQIQTYNDLIFSLMHFLIASLSFINYFNPNVKQNQDYVAIAKIVSYMSITALVFNIVVLFYGGIIDHTSAIYALKYLTLPSAASSITLLILLSLNTVNVFMHNDRLNSIQK